MIGSIIEGALGLLLACVTLRDVFDTVVIPGGAKGLLRVSRRLVFVSLPVWKRVRQRPIGVNFAPLVLVATFIVWMLLLVVSFGMLAHAFGDWFSPKLRTIGEGMYLAGSAMVTIGVGRSEPHGIAAVIAVAAGFCGLAVMTMAVTYLLEVQSNISVRDTGVLKITTSSGQPPSGLGLLERYASLDCRDEIPDIVRGGRDWCAAVLQSHASHPSLIYFRSVGTSSGWPATLGALFDLALVLEMVLEREAGKGAAVLLCAQAGRLAQDITGLLRLQPATESIGEQDVRALCARLMAAGYRLRGDFDVQRFIARRNEHFSRVDALAQHLGTSTAPLVP